MSPTPAVWLCFCFASCIASADHIDEKVDDRNATGSLGAPPGCHSHCDCGGSGILETGSCSCSCSNSCYAGAWCSCYWDDNQKQKKVTQWCGDAPPPRPPSPSPAPPPPPPLPPPLSTGEIRSLQSGLCWDLPGGDMTNGNRLWTWECNGQWQQQFYFGAGGRIFLLRDQSKCVDLPGNDWTNGNQLQIWDCNGGPQQRWGYDGDQKTIYLSSSASDASKCLDLRNGGRTPGTPFQIWDCLNGYQNQLWRVAQYGSPLNKSSSLDPLYVV